MRRIAFLLACLAGILLGVATAGNPIGLLLGMVSMTCSYFSGALFAIHFTEEDE